MTQAVSENTRDSCESDEEGGECVAMADTGSKQSTHVSQQNPKRRKKCFQDNMVEVFNNYYKGNFFSMYIIMV